MKERYILKISGYLYVLYIKYTSFRFFYRLLITQPLKLFFPKTYKKIISKRSLLLKYSFSSNNKLNRYYYTAHLKQRINVFNKIPKKNFNQKLLLAYISPIPPDKSGIAKYSEELLKKLSDIYEIHVITNSTIYNSELKNNVKFTSINEFKESYLSYDRVLYHFGNSGYHKEMYDFFWEFPGVIVLHDIILQDLISKMSCLDNNFLNYKKYYSHGYKALITTEVKYPCNLDLLQHSFGIIVHSPYSIEQIEKYYGPLNSDRYKIIPLISKNLKLNDCLNLKSKLSIEENDFVICVFGDINGFKYEDLILEAFNDINIKNRKTKLIFAGNNSSSVGLKLQKDSLNLNNRNIVFTGYISDEEYCNYLKIANIAIQLRKISHGESSYALFDCLTVGVPVIVNKIGSFNFLPHNIVLKISEAPSKIEIANAVTKLLNNPEIRNTLKNEGLEYIKNNHNPEICSSLYENALNDFYSNNIKASYKMMKDHNSDYIKTISSMNNPRLKQLFIDVTAISAHDLDTGIQKNIKAQLIELIKSPPKNFKIEPVYLVYDNEWKYKYANNFTSNILDVNLNFIESEIEIFSEDILYIPDLYHGIAQAFQSGYFEY